MVPNTLKDGRIKFDDKSKARIDRESDPKVEEVSFVKPVNVLMVDIVETTEANEPNYQEKLKVVFPKAEEELIDFLNQCKLKDFEVMLCPRCSSVFDKEAPKKLENPNTEYMKKFGHRDQ